MAKLLKIGSAVTEIEDIKIGTPEEIKEGTAKEAEPVSGEVDNSGNWTSITIGDTTGAIPAQSTPVVPQRTVILESFVEGRETDDNGEVQVDLPSGVELADGDMLFIQACSYSWGAYASATFRYNKNASYYEIAALLDYGANTTNFIIDFGTLREVKVGLYGNTEDHNPIAGETIDEIILYKLPF